MKKLYNYLIFILTIMIIAVVISIILDKNFTADISQNNKDEKNNLINKTDDILDLEYIPSEQYEVPKFISKALAVKMVALSKDSKETIAIKEREINFTDSGIDDWYDKYFNIAVLEGWFEPQDKLLNPLEPLTYKEANKILSYFIVDKDYNKLEDSDEPISYDEWITIFNELLELTGNKENLEVKDLYVFATSAIDKKLNNWEVVTDCGKYTFEGINVDGCIDKKIKVLARNNELLHIYSVSDNNELLKNVYVSNVKSDENKINIFMEGVERTLKYSKQLLIDDSKSYIADVKIVNHTIEYINMKKNAIKGVIKKISYNEVEVENYGVFKISSDAKFYKLYDEIDSANYKNVIVGYDTSELILDEENIVQGVLIKEKANITDIRVVINNTNFTSLIHKEVILSSKEKYTISKGENSQELEGLYKLNLDDVKFDVGERVTITPTNNEKITIYTIERGGSNKFNPSYRGIIEIEKLEDGYKIVNEVDFEEYLYSVVPSEMPSSYGLMASKVQAICARSYAYNSFYSNAFSSHGAHVDDSTSCQVYNNVEENEISIRAVEETKGQLLSYNDQVISTNFFSTSCGITADVGDVWADYVTKDFPTSSVTYLTSKLQNDSGEKDIDYSNEEDFRKFILDYNFPSYDQNYSWYRWTVDMSSRQIKEAINKNISNRYNANPKLIKTLDDNNIFRSRPVEKIGDIIDLKVESRGKSGIITEMIIETTTGVYKIGTEYNIRKLIAPVNYVDGGEEITITKKDGSKTSNMSIMPSAFYVMDKTYDENGNLLNVTFHGGGYGHGVGMSQNGVKTMVELGYGYEEILKHYYEGTNIKTLQ